MYMYNVNIYITNKTSQFIDLSFKKIVSIYNPVLLWFVMIHSTYFKIQPCKIYNTLKIQISLASTNHKTKKYQPYIKYIYRQCWL